MRHLYLILICLIIPYLSFSQDEEFFEEVPEFEEDTPKPKIVDGVITGTYFENHKLGFKRRNAAKTPAVYTDMMRVKDKRGMKWYIVERDGKYAVLNRYAGVVVPFIYEEIKGTTFENSECFLVKKDGRWGAVTTRHAEVLPVKYYGISYCNPARNIFLVLDDDGQMHFLKKDGSLSTEVISGHYVDVHKNGFIAPVNGKWGFVKDGEIVIPFEHKDLGTTRFSNGPSKRTGLAINHHTATCFMVENEDGMKGLIDISGETILPFNYDEIRYDSRNKLYQFTKNRKKGALKPAEGVMIDAIYDHIHFSFNYIMVTQDGKQGVLHKDGKELIPTEYDKVKLKAIGPDLNGFEVTRDRKMGWLNGQGEILIEPIYEKIEEWKYIDRKGLYKLHLGKKQGVITKKGKTVVPTEYDFVYMLNDLFAVREGEKVGLYHEEDKLVQVAEFDKFKRSNIRGSKLLKGYKNGQQYLIDQHGKFALPTAFQAVTYIHNTLGILSPSSANATAALALKDDQGNCGVFDEMLMALIIPLEYEQVVQKFETQEHSYFVLQQKGKFGLVNEKNEVVIPFKYDALNLDHVFFVPEAEAYVVAQKKGKYGLINLQHEVVLPLKYQGLSRIANNEIYKAKKDGKFMVIDATGKTLNAGPFDEVADFEGKTALTFSENQMRLINAKGEFVSEKQTMKPHVGYRTFEELKQAFLKAMESADDQLLREFAEKTAPSKHMLYFLKINMFDGKPLEGLYTPDIIDRYYERLYNFKRNEWNSDRFSKWKLLEVEDFTRMKKNREGWIQNWRATDHAFGSRFLEDFLRNSIKVNGFWISTYFMHRRFK